MSGEEARALRRELGLTRRKMAEVLRVNRTTVLRWEKGEREMGGPTETLLELLVERHREIRRSEA